MPVEDLVGAVWMVPIANADFRVEAGSGADDCELGELCDCGQIDLVVPSA